MTCQQDDDSKFAAWIFRQIGDRPSKEKWQKLYERSKRSDLDALIFSEADKWERVREVALKAWNLKENEK